MNSIIFGLVGFFLGNISGYFFHDVLGRIFKLEEEAIRSFLVVSITLMWILSMLVDILSPAYDVPVAAHTIMGLVAGFFFYRPKNTEVK